MRIQLRQLLQRIADHQGQRHSTVGQRQALETLMDRYVLRQQLIGKHLEFRPQRQGALQVGGTQRVLFDTDKMHPRTGRRMLFEHLPGAQKIQPRTETGLADDQSTPLRQRSKTLRQTVLLDEHVTGFVQPRLIGEIHIVEHARIRTTLVVPIELGVGQYRFHGRLGNGKTAILADRDQWSVCAEPPL
ncbi:hypothetical protein D3C87_1091810 [compost metagenome]